MKFKTKLVTSAQTPNKQAGFPQKLPNETAVLHNVFESQSTVYLDIDYLGLIP